MMVRKKRVHTVPALPGAYEWKDQRAEEDRKKRLDGTNRFFAKMEQYARKHKWLVIDTSELTYVQKRDIMDHILTKKQKARVQAIFYDGKSVIQCAKDDSVSERTIYDVLYGAYARTIALLQINYNYTIKDTLAPQVVASTAKSAETSPQNVPDIKLSELLAIVQGREKDNAAIAAACQKITFIARELLAIATQLDGKDKAVC